jgi:L-fuculose-phosphate aldolase
LSALLPPTHEAAGQDEDRRRQLVEVVQRLDRLGLNRGSTGNASVRASAGGFWITATGMGADETEVDTLVHVDDAGRASGRWRPSSEWQFHRAIYACRSDLHAVLHTHAVNATALACLGRRLPPFHYMVAVAGGDDVPCVPYHLFGTPALGEDVARAFEARHACLLAHHGLVAGGTSLAHAARVLVEVEALCEAYLKALAVREPTHLSASQMAEVIERFRHYGQPESR